MGRKGKGKKEEERRKEGKKERQTGTRRERHKLGGRSPSSAKFASTMSFPWRRQLRIGGKQRGSLSTKQAPLSSYSKGSILSEHKKQAVNSILALCYAVLIQAQLTLIHPPTQPCLHSSTHMVSDNICSERTGIDANPSKSLCRQGFVQTTFGHTATIELPPWHIKLL